jgi:hypothetical protein
MYKFILVFILISCSCTSRPSNEIEALSGDVLKHGQGIEIDVKPIPKN